MGKVQDIIWINVWGLHFFMDIDNQPYSDENNYVGSFIKRIPGQVSDKGMDKMIDSVSNSAFETFKALFTL